MSYIINNSRGNVVAIIADGTVNTTATDLALVGRALTDYGTYENENYVYLLENFANSTAPLQPILGQLWYNSATDTLSAYNSGNTWTALASQDYVQAQKISPTFTGVPTAPTAIVGTSNTQIATTAFVINQLVNASSISAVGNITGGNFITSGSASASGSITSSGNISGGNVLTAGIVSAAGNVYGANFVGNVISPAGSNVSTTGNVIGGNILTSGLISASGNITGYAINISTTISAVGNIYGSNFFGNVITPVGSPVSTTGNVTGGNLLTGGIASATGTVTGGNLLTGGIVSATGTVTGNNLLTGGIVSATGNITSSNTVLANNVIVTNMVTTSTVSASGNITTPSTVIADTVIANSVITTGTTSAFRLPNLNQAQINALSPNAGDMVYNTTTNLPQVYQNGSWKNFTISYYS